MSLFNYGDSLLNKYGYKAALDSLVSLEKQRITASTTEMDKSIHYQALMTFYSFVGDNYNSINYEEKAFPYSRHDLNIFSKNYKIVDAEEYIKSHYSNQQIIMFNESHNRGENRAFVKKLLPMLYREGYHFFAAEAFDTKYNIDSSLNQRTYPIQKTGYYVREPAFGQLVREALSLGFQCVSYEDTSKTLTATAIAREQNQANAIYSFIKNNPKAKIIIYAGYDHIYKQAQNGQTRMAEILCKLLGKNIPTIDCVTLKEFNNKKLENDVYRALDDSLKINKSSIILLNDTAFVSAKLKGKVDACVYLPPTNYDLTYPNWLKETNDSFYELKIPKEIKTEESFLQVYNSNEWNKEKTNAIPIIQFIINPKKSNYKLFLKKGKHCVFIYDKQNTLLFEKSLMC